MSDEWSPAAGEPRPVARQDTVKRVDTYAKEHGWVAVAAAVLSGLLAGAIVLAHRAITRYQDADRAITRLDRSS